MRNVQADLRKKRRKVRVFDTTRTAENFSINIMGIGDLKTNVLIGIFFYTCYAYNTVFDRRISSNVVKTMENWFKGGEGCT
ncbi:uncharacterized protein VNE69_12151 [Vairimorpha necatrix]|uniref:Uncharacterized protein n=1 Tax=Vairimorpha necatrix TaxID=6039 RepID=A0AAX4JIG7_9MICR